jgi:hypothetical protein
MIKSIVLAFVGLAAAIVLLIAALLAFSLLVMALGAILNVFSPRRSTRPAAPETAAP